MAKNDLTLVVELWKPLFIFMKVLAPAELIPGDEHIKLNKISVEIIYENIFHIKLILKCVCFKQRGLGRGDLSY